jgi:FimV-like protein
MPASTNNSLIVNTLFSITLLLIVTTTTAQPTVKLYGPIQEGDMLWNIATTMRPDESVSRYQVMMALLQINPTAFEVPCNVNSLKIGKTLQVPSLEAIKMFDRTQAFREFNRQGNEWKNYRKYGQKINCSLTSIKNSAAQATTTFFAPSTKLATNAALPIKSPNSAESLHTQNAIPLTTFTSQVTSFFKQHGMTLPAPWLIVISILVVSIIILIFLLMTRPQPASHANHSAKKAWSEDPVEKMSVDTVKEMPQPLNTSENATHTDVAPKNNDMKEKLDYVRCYLAEDQAQLTERLLKEVVQKGTDEQQAEARQLYEINKKINLLRQYTGNKSFLPIYPSSASNSPIWQEIEQLSGHFPAQYLPENRERVFQVIDKIFELLDYELKAQGKLIDAYVKRHQEDFFQDTNYQVVGKPIKTAEGEGNGSFRPAPKPTRHL